MKSILFKDDFATTLLLEKGGELGSSRQGGKSGCHRYSLEINWSRAMLTKPKQSFAVDFGRLLFYAL